VKEAKNMSAQNNQNRKLQNIINNVKMADDAIGNAELDGVQTKTLKFLYNAAVIGGTAGAAYALTDDSNTAQTIPDNAVITNCYFELSDTITSGGSATIALGFTGDTDAFIAATAYNNAAFTATASTKNAGVPVKTTAAVSVLATIATADLTAGTFFLWVEYYEGIV